eukprot:6183728-Pleurochrysis_carterae.AAC.2
MLSTTMSCEAHADTSSFEVHLNDEVSTSFEVHSMRLRWCTPQRATSNAGAQLLQTWSLDRPLAADAR